MAHGVQEKLAFVANARALEYRMKLVEIAQQLGCRVEGDGSIDIRGVAGIEHAGAGELTFVSNPRYVHATRTTQASAVLLGHDIRVEREPSLTPLAVLRSANPYLDFARALELFYPSPRYAPGIHPSAVIAQTAIVGPGAHIGPHCFVDEGVVIGRSAVLHSLVSIYRNAHIGDDFFAHSHTVVREGCRIGDRVILQNGAVIGGDGFGFAKRDDGRWHKIPQTGITVLGDDVEIQANSCIDRATVGETIVARGVKIDDLVLVGHGGKIGEDSLLCGQAGMAGTTTIGKSCILGGQVGCSGHLTVGDGTMLTPQTGVSSDVPPNSLYSGAPAVEHKQWLKGSAAFKRLPELLSTVRKLEQEIVRLSERRTDRSA
jgi:UDP-3-O-[3-hydroxymyristoyl] glucosamine N-acyltransferase